MEGSAVVPVSVATVLAVGTPAHIHSLTVPCGWLYPSVDLQEPLQTAVSFRHGSDPPHTTDPALFLQDHSTTSPGYFCLKWVKYITETVTFPLLWGLIMPCTFMVFHAPPDLCVPHPQRLQMFFSLSPAKMSAKHKICNSTRNLLLFQFVWYRAGKKQEPNYSCLPSVLVDKWRNFECSSALTLDPGFVPV